VFLVKTNNPRALDPKDILVRAGKRQKNITVHASVKEALDLLTGRQKETAPILVTGSFYLWQRYWT
jgi:folylpolyglutamate synthase/dihydropteroate synthase